MVITKRLRGTWHAWHFQFALSLVVKVLCGHFCIACLRPLTRRYVLGRNQVVERITYESLPQIAGPYVHATKHNKTLYISGLTAYGTEAQTSGLTEQTKEILEQISEVLRLEKRLKSDLVKLTIFVRDMSMLGSIRELLFNFYDGNLPACSLVEVSKLIHADLQIEIEAVVAL